MASEWRATTWGDEISLEYGKALRGYSAKEGLYRVFGSNGPIGWHNEAISKGPGVILGRKGAYRGVQYSRDPFFVIDTAYYVVPKTEIDLRWLYYAIIHHRLGEIDDGSPIPSTTRAAVYIRDLDVPPIDEQHAIAHVLGTLDDKIELNRRINETLESTARVLFKSWFVDFDPVRAKAEGRNSGLPRPLADLFPDSFEDSEVGEIPKGWHLGTVDEDFNLTMGQSPPGETYNEIGAGLPFFQGRADFGFRFPQRRVYCTAPTRFAQPGDTLVSVRAPVGDINMATERCCVGRGVAAVRHKSGSRSYTYYYMHSLRQVFDKFEAEGTVFGSIGKKDFHAITRVAPSDSLVSAFERIAYPMDEGIYTNTRGIDTLSALRDTLLPKLISGELRLPDAERIVGGQV
jgi:type I restriction enzyme S subunit